MWYLLGARVSFGLAVVCFALAASLGLASSTLAHLSAALVLGLAALGSSGRTLLGSALKDRSAWLTGLIVWVSNVCAANAAALLDLPVLAALSLTATLWAVVLAPLYGDRVLGADVIGLLLGGVGAALVVSPALSGGSRLGILLGLTSAMMVTVFTQRFRAAARLAAHRPEPYMATVMMVGGLAGLASLPWGDAPSQQTLLWSTAAGLCLAAGNVFNVYGLRTVTATRAVLLRPLSSLTSAAAGVLFLDDPLTAGIVAGGLLIIAAGQFISVAHRRAAAKPAS